jgi:uncharacterized SAM-binding protein YcdF (DUF218 family)
MLDSLGYAGKDCLLVTSAFHMRRSLACFRKVGLEMDDFPVDFYAFQRHYTLDAFIVPKIDALGVWHKLVKEWVGFVAYWAAGYV